MDRMANAVSELSAQSIANDEKFTRVHERIDDVGKLANQTNKSLSEITTKILPNLQTAVSLNSFTGTAFWKIAGMVFGLSLAGGWAMMERFHSIQSSQNAILIEALKNVPRVTKAPEGA